MPVSALLVGLTSFAGVRPHVAVLDGVRTMCRMRGEATKGLESQPIHILANASGSAAHHRA